MLLKFYFAIIEIKILSSFNLVFLQRGKRSCKFELKQVKEKCIVVVSMKKH